jgi:UDP-N-acetylglucosamine 1-carboxyvinyltransferase
MKWLEVRRSSPLKGSISVPGSKNSSLALLAAGCMADAPVILENIPHISDIDVMSGMAQEAGAVISRVNKSIKISPQGIRSFESDPLKSASIRTSYYYIGALLARCKKVSVGYPGGDKIGPRPIDQHIKGLQALGARFDFHDSYYTVEADGLTGSDIYFDVITSGATINIMMAAALAKGRSVLHNAARDPEVVDVAVLLNKMGARIWGAGTDTIRIDGVAQLGGCTHQVIPDRLVAGAFLMAAGITGGRITVEGIIPEHLEACTGKLAEIGLYIEKTDNTITAEGPQLLKATRVRAGMYPMLGSDFQQPITALLLKAAGRSTISDKVYPLRFNHCEQLIRMGADISVKYGIARINSLRPLKGAWVHASDIRSGTCLILAGMIADGITSISGVEHLERGYEDVVESLKSLGADVRMNFSAGDRESAVQSHQA